MIRPTLIDLSSYTLGHYPFMVVLDRCNGNFNALFDPPSRICISNKTEDFNLNGFNMITRINEAKILKIQ